MWDADTFLTTVYVIVDDYVRAQPLQRRQPGPAAALSWSEVATLALFAQWRQFRSERAPTATNHHTTCARPETMSALLITLCRFRKA